MNRTPSSAAPAREHGDAVQGPGSGSTLSNGLKQRHLSMIALGGVIGAGLFVGSREGIAAAARPSCWPTPSPARWSC